MFYHHIEENLVGDHSSTWAPLSSSEKIASSHGSG